MSRKAPGKLVIRVGDSSENTPLEGELTINYPLTGHAQTKGPAI
jgi:hypothetical protein